MTKNRASDWLRVDEVAKILGVQRVTVYNYIKTGKLAANKISRDYVVTKAALEEFKDAKYSKKGGRPRKKKSTKKRGPE